MQTSQNVQSIPQSGGMSLEQRFIDLYIQSLLTLQSCWMNHEGKVDTIAFGLQTEFIINLIPDEAIQAQIRRDQVRLTDLYKKAGDAHPTIRAGMTAVGSAVKFLVDTFELKHLDITCPATDNEFIFIPDVRQDVTDATP